MLANTVRSLLPGMFWERLAERTEISGWVAMCKSTQLQVFRDNSTIIYLEPWTLLMVKKAFPWNAMIPDKAEELLEWVHVLARTLLACPALLTLTRSLSPGPPLGTPLCLWLSCGVSRADIFLSLSPPSSAVLESFAGVPTFLLSVLPHSISFQGLAEDSSICVWSQSCVQDLRIHTACLLLKLVRSWVPCPLPSRGALLWAWLHNLFATKTTFTTVCCYSVAKLCPTLCDPMNCSTPGFPVLHYLLEFAQIHVHWVGDVIQPSHPLPPPSPFFFFFFFFLLQLLGLKTSILFLKVSPCILTFKGFKGVTCPTGSIFLSAPSFMVSLSSASGSGPFLTCVWRWLKLLFLVSLSSPPTAVKLCDCWPWTSNSR